MLQDQLKHVAVVGAAGKMGSGIVLVLLQEMAKEEAKTTGRVGSGEYRLVCIDTQEEGLLALKNYLKSQIQRFAEKNIIKLRTFYAKNLQLISNEEIICAFVEGALEIIVTDTALHRAKEAHLIFEAVVEDPIVKFKIFSELQKLCSSNACFFSNTSSIPIQELNTNGELEGRICGFHFYNPPSVQKLVELVFLKNKNNELEATAIELAKKMGKTPVISCDVAGFIGNGYFMRELIFAVDLVRSLSTEGFDPGAIVAVNRVSQEYLLRPMGIFQLIDYVGIDICQNILKIMGEHISGESFQCELIDRMAAAKIFGGQISGNKQKDGFFKYENHQPSAVYSLKKGDYVTLDVCSDMGRKPDENLSWKSLHNDPVKAEKLKSYFQKLWSDQTLGCTLARKYLSKTQEIAKNLVRQGVASSMKDVNTVLELGFGHLYGAENGLY